MPSIQPVWVRSQAFHMLPLSPVWGDSSMQSQELSLRIAACGHQTQQNSNIRLERESTGSKTLALACGLWLTLVQSLSLFRVPIYFLITESSTVPQFAGCGNPNSDVGWSVPLVSPLISYLPSKLSRTVTPTGLTTIFLENFGVDLGSGGPGGLAGEGCMV